MSSTDARAAVARVSFVAGDNKDWGIDQVKAICGDGLLAAATLNRVEGFEFFGQGSAAWVLRGVRSHDRYLERSEKERLISVQEGLGRPASSRAVLIPIRKSDAWWDLPQDERRAVFEARSHHIAIGSQYLPAIARRLYHCRELGEPFDFLTWFEFNEVDAGLFGDLVGRLRETEEWRYVAREVEIHLHRR